LPWSRTSEDDALLVTHRLESHDIALEFERGDSAEGLEAALAQPGVRFELERLSGRQRLLCCSATP
jgi:hypothetical protein